MSSQRWTVKKRGFSTIHVLAGNAHAVVDRNGYGWSAANGCNITYNGKAYPNIESAKAAAVEDRKARTQGKQE